MNLTQKIKKEKWIKTIYLIITIIITFGVSIYLSFIFNENIIIQILNTLILCVGLVWSVKILFDIDDSQMKLKDLKGEDINNGKCI